MGGVRGCYEQASYQRIASRLTSKQAGRQVLLQGACLGRQRSAFTCTQRLNASLICIGKYPVPTIWSTRGQEASITQDQCGTIAMGCSAMGIESTCGNRYHRPPPTTEHHRPPSTTDKPPTTNQQSPPTNHRPPITTDNDGRQCQTGCYNHRITESQSTRVELFLQPVDTDTAVLKVFVCHDPLVEGCQ